MKPLHPELAMVGMRILSQVISVSSCERNWSAHGQKQTKIRNISPQTNEKLVHVYSNSKKAASVRDADELKMFAWDNEVVLPASLVRRSSGVVPGL